MKKRILIIDDDYSIRLLLHHILCDHYEVKTAESGKEALLWLFDGNVPDLIISDVMMSEMNGMEFVSQLKASSFFKNIPLMMLSSLEKSEDRIKCYDLGVDEFISKPFNPSELQLRIKYFLRTQKIA